MKIPKFKSEQEEIEFWDTHSSVNYLEDSEEVKDPPELSDELKEKIIGRKQKKRLLTLRLDQELIDRTKEIAQRKAIGYQTLMRMWIAESLNRENLKL
jgi:predicted DNA binding CopG/RHH family protein